MLGCWLKFKSFFLFISPQNHDFFKIKSAILDLDTRIGFVLGHHSSTGELCAIHRNQKTYLIFHNIQNKWIVLSNNQFKKDIFKNIDQDARRNLEEDTNDQIFTLGTNQWMGILPFFTPLYPSLNIFSLILVYFCKLFFVRKLTFFWIVILGNSEGLFFRKLESDSWLQRVRWHV